MEDAERRSNQYDTMLAKFEQRSRLMTQEKHETQPSGGGPTASMRRRRFLTWSGPSPDCGGSGGSDGLEEATKAAAEVDQ
ncbi:hypothetical protein EYF80_062151 [Liparis tanakae]|uniref:Uncharacterized protein n=1 Tax=Liparis tanakae TaxID=230148 RepID=A0A4Z2EG02_9TELE|nr:hypothetical protein EYF80_062151 [Liparis tanakae]